MDRALVYGTRGCWFDSRRARFIHPNYCLMAVKRKTTVSKASTTTPAHSNPETLFKQLVDQTADGIMTVNPRGTVLYINKAAKELLRRPIKRIIGKHYIYFLDRPSRIKARKYIMDIRSGVGVVRDELNLIDDHKRITPIEFTVSPIHDQGKVVQLHISLRDISERRQLEQVAREAAKTKALQHFITGTSHEIQHPLKGLIVQADNLLKLYRERDFEYIGFKEFTRIFDDIDQMRDQLQYAHDTIERLVKISQQKVGIKENSCDANRVIREAIQALKDNIAKADVSVNVRLARKLPTAAIGEIELSQVLIKIVTNAIQSLTMAGRVDIKSSYIKAENCIRIDCTDNGIGIEKDDLSRVFDPFFSTKERGVEKNAGLGLAIVYSIIKSYQGSISIKSNPNDGTRVRLMLPVVKSSKKTA